MFLLYSIIVTVIVLIALWYSLSFTFKKIGKVFDKKHKKFKKKWGEN